MHHARSWGSSFVLGQMLPLKGVSGWSAEEYARRCDEWAATTAQAASYGIPLVAQVWGPLSLLTDSVGAQAVMRDLVYDPLAIERGSDAMGQRTEALVSAALQAGAQVIWVAEPMLALLDPANILVHMTWRLTRLAALVHAGGRDMVVHVSGTAPQALPALAQTRVDGVSITSGTPLESALELPGQIVVFGNLDRAELLALDEPALELEARRMAAMMRGRPYVATPGSALPEATPPSHLAAFLDAARSEPGLGARV